MSAPAEIALRLIMTMYEAEALINLMFRHIRYQYSEKKYLIQKVMYNLLNLKNY